MRAVAQRVRRARISVAGEVVGEMGEGLLALVGVVNLPIIKYSVDWWSTLHQPATIAKLGKPTISWDMLWPLLLVWLGATLFLVAVTLMRARAITASGKPASLAHWMPYDREAPPSFSVRKNTISWPTSPTATCRLKTRGRVSDSAVSSW